MLTNTIEYEEWQTGKNHAAIAFTVRPFMVKLSGAVQYGVVALTLIVCGLYTITNSVGDVEVAIGMLNEGESLIYCLDYLKELGFKHLGFNKRFERSQPRYTFRRFFKNYKTIESFTEFIERYYKNDNIDNNNDNKCIATDINEKALNSAINNIKKLFVTEVLQKNNFYIEDNSLFTNLSSRNIK